MQAADEVEAQLGMLPENLPGYEELQVALSLYRPGGGDHLLDEAQLQRTAREVLHDLGQHELCVHG